MRWVRPQAHLVSCVRRWQTAADAEREREVGLTRVSFSPIPFPLAASSLEGLGTSDLDPMPLSLMLNCDERPFPQSTCPIPFLQASTTSGGNDFHTFMTCCVKNQMHLEVVLGPGED